MSNKIRLEYLERNWAPYPTVEEKVLSPQEFEKEFSLLTAGAKTRIPEVVFCGRLSEILRSPLGEGVDRFVLTRDGRAYTFQTDLLDADKKRLIDQVFQVGDQLLVRFDWHNVYTSGLFPKIENIKPKDLVLLAPAKAEMLFSDFNSDRAKQWELYLKLVRQCFEFLGFTEVRTSTLVTSPGLEPYLNPFETKFKSGQQETDFYLPTSPEFELKKVLSTGMSRIFEFKPSFRNEEMSSHHRPEFWMLEWYRAYADLASIKKDIKGLLNYLKLHWPQPLKGWAALKEISVAELFLKFCDFQLTPQTTKEELVTLAQEMGIQTSSTDDWDDVYFRIFLEKIEPHLGMDGPLIVKDYPPSQCAWARITREGWADRFELYWRGVELANAYHELNNPAEQLARFEKANQKRRQLGKPEMPIDKKLMQALESGFPPSGGIALGLDRLFMLLIDKSDIGATRFEF